MLTYLQENKFLSEYQSGFRRNDSCSSQLIAITRDIYKYFDANSSLETRGVFLDISKAFDKVWHDGLLYKLKFYGVEGGLFNILQNYLQNRKQRVVLNGQSSSWLDVNARVPQDSVLGPYLFLMTYPITSLVKRNCVLMTRQFFLLFSISQGPVKLY